MSACRHDKVGGNMQANTRFQRDNTTISSGWVCSVFAILSQKRIKLIHDRKDSSKRREYLGFYLYICHVIRRFYYTSFCSTKVGEKFDVAKF